MRKQQGMTHWYQDALPKLVLLQVDDTVTFKLLQRPRDSIIPKEVMPNHPHATPDSTPTKPEDLTNTTPLSTWGSARHDPTATTAAATAATATGQTIKSNHRGDKKTDTKGKAAADTKSSIKSRGRGHKQDRVEEGDDDGRGFNKYAKFTTVGDGKAFWKAAAEELARYAAQVHAVLSCCMLVMLRSARAHSSSSLMLCINLCCVVPCCAIWRHAGLQHGSMPCQIRQMGVCS